MKKIITIFLITSGFLVSGYSSAETNLAQKLSGKILLQVESHGEAWYVNPKNSKKYFLNRPQNAFEIMQTFGIGINNNNLSKFQVGLLDYVDKDDDNDGLANRLEIALGTNKDKKDSDNDGYDDKTEIEKNYNPLGNGNMPFDYNFAKNNIGKIFLQIEKNGEAWYINPNNLKRYFLGRPQDAFSIMRELSLGINNNNLNKIETAVIENEEKENNNPILPPTCETCKNTSQSKNAIANVANAIRSGNTTNVLKYFIPEMKKAIEYTMDFLDTEGRLTLGNIISGATLDNQTSTKAIYKNEVYFSLGGYKVPIYFYLEKQDNGEWLMTNL